MRQPQRPGLQMVHGRLVSPDRVFAFVNNCLAMHPREPQHPAAEATCEIST